MKKAGIKRGWLAKKNYERGQRALERQLDYQEKKSLLYRGNETAHALNILNRSQFIRKKLEEIKVFSKDSRVLEVGCGAHGLIFGLGTKYAFGIDPLAVDYKRLFPVWQKNAQTVSAIGEELPFADASFDFVLSDNVIDHAEKPLKIIEELARVLKPEGVLYFTVNVHHPIYQVASNLHGLWNALGIKFEISPFADHTIHLTENRIKKSFQKLPFRIIEQNSTVSQIKKGNRHSNVRGLEWRFKKLFYKNALYELIAIKN
jgi:ubiquinone/menaquinone biosynthesis C-methylase UbiE